MILVILLLVGLGAVNATDVNDTSLITDTPEPTSLESLTQETTPVQTEVEVLNNHESTTYNNIIDIDSTYDGKTITINDSTEVKSSSNHSSTDLSLNVIGNNVKISGLNITNTDENKKTIICIRSENYLTSVSDSTLNGNEAVFDDGIDNYVEDNNAYTESIQNIENSLTKTIFLTKKTMNNKKTAVNEQITITPENFNN